MRKIKAGGDEAQGVVRAKKNPNVGKPGLMGLFKRFFRALLFSFLNNLIEIVPCPIGFWIDEKRKDEVGFGGIW